MMVWGTAPCPARGLHPLIPSFIFGGTRVNVERGKIDEGWRYIGCRIGAVDKLTTVGAECTGQHLLSEVGIKEHLARLHFPSAECAVHGHAADGASIRAESDINYTIFEWNDRAIGCSAIGF